MVPFWKSRRRLQITMAMAEDYRSGLVWNTSMKNSEAQAAMTKVGFHRA
jgi:hypothetical protein